MKSQEKNILAHLQSGKSLTPLEALKEYGCFRLSGRIYDLKKAGYDIKMQMVKENKKYFAKYYFPKKENLAS